ncbi:MAG: metal-sulfur cluster assembly factor [Pannonibacter sp.]
MSPDGETRIKAALGTVDDPELGVSIMDLGLVRKITIAPGAVTIVVAMTTPTCPLGGLIAELARAAVEAVVDPGTSVMVHLDRNFRWEPHFASPHVRERFEAPMSGVAGRLRGMLASLIG